MLCLIAGLLKFDTLVHYGTFDAAELLKSTSDQMKMADDPQIFIL